MKLKITRTIFALLAAMAIAAFGSRASALDYEATFGPGANAKIAQAMLEGLLDESARIIKDAYGIDGRSNNKLTVMWDDDPLSGQRLDKNAAAAAGGDIGIPRSMIIYLSRAYFADQSDIDQKLNELRLTVLHELVHGMQFTSDPGLMGGALAHTAPKNDGSNPLAQFLIEGMAEHAGAGNRRVQAYARKRRIQNSQTTDQQIASDIIASITRTITAEQGYTNAEEMEMYYITSYLATRWFDSQSKAHGGTGVKGLLEYLERYIGSAQGPAAGDVFDAAVRHGSNGYFQEHADLYNSMLDARTNKTLPFCGFVLGVVQEDANTDAGRIGGYHAEGKQAKTLAQLVQDLSGKPASGVPLAAYGFDEVTIFGKTSRVQRPSDGGSSQTPPSGGDSWVDAPHVDATVHEGLHDSAVQGGTADASGRRTITFTPSATTKTLVIKIDVDLSKLVSVAIGGKTLTRGQDYKATEGSTVIEFSEAYLASLAEGTPHAVSVKFNDGGTVGTAELFVIKTADTPPAQPDQPQSGSGSSGGGCAAGACASLALALAASRRRGANA